MRDWRSVWTDIEGRYRGVVITEVSASRSRSTVTVAPGVARTWHITSHLLADSIRGEDLGEGIVVYIEGVVIVKLWEDEIGGRM